MHDTTAHLPPSRWQWGKCYTVAAGAANSFSNRRNGEEPGGRLVMPGTRDAGGRDAGWCCAAPRAAGTGSPLCWREWDELLGQREAPPKRTSSWVGVWWGKRWHRVSPRCLDLGVAATLPTAIRCHCCPKQNHVPANLSDRPEWLRCVHFVPCYLVFFWFGFVVVLFCFSQKKPLLLSPWLLLCLSRSAPAMFPLPDSGDISAVHTLSPSVQVCAAGDTVEQAMPFGLQEMIQKCKARSIAKAPKLWLFHITFFWKETTKLHPFFWEAQVKIVEPFPLDR